MSRRKKTRPNAQAAVDTVRCGALEAQQIVLKDAAGNVSAQLGCGPDGEAQLRFFGPQGQNRVAVGACAGATGLWLFDDEGRPRVEVAVPRAGEPVGVCLKDTDGAVRVSLTLNEDTAQLELFDAAGQVRVLTAFADEGFGVFQHYDASGVIGATLGLVDGTVASLGLSAESRKELTGLRALEGGGVGMVAGLANKPLDDDPFDGGAGAAEAGPVEKLFRTTGDIDATLN